MKDWFQNLDTREQLLVTAGALFTGVALLYLMLWRPLSTQTAKLENRVEAQQETLDSLARLEGRVSPPSSGAPGSGPRGQSLVVLVSQTVDKFKLDGALKSSQPAGGGRSIRVQFEDASFDTMVSWLGEMQQHHGLSVQSASFNRRELSKGRVDSSLTLERRQ